MKYVSSLRLILGTCNSPAAVMSCCSYSRVTCVSVFFTMIAVLEANFISQKREIKITFFPEEASFFCCCCSFIKENRRRKVRREGILVNSDTVSAALHWYIYKLKVLLCAVTVSFSFKLWL